MSDAKIMAIKVISQKGHCGAGHKVGDEWLITDGKTPPGICLAAFNSLYPNLRVLTFGGDFPWSTEPGVANVACTDAKNPVTFEIRRLQK